MNDETVILSLKTGTYHGLDEVGARIWTLLQEPRTIADLVGVVTAEFEVEPRRCEADLTSLVHSLHDAGLVEIVSPL